MKLQPLPIVSRVARDGAPSWVYLAGGESAEASWSRLAAAGCLLPPLDIAEALDSRRSAALRALHCEIVRTACGGGHIDPSIATAALQVVCEAGGCTSQVAAAGSADLRFAVCWAIAAVERDWYRDACRTGLFGPAFSALLARRSIETELGAVDPTAFDIRTARRLRQFIVHLKRHGPVEAPVTLPGARRHALVLVPNNADQ